MTDIMKQIDQMVADKTFSLDALEGIKVLKDEFASLQQQLIETKRHNDHLEEMAKHSYKEKADAMEEMRKLKQQIAEDNDTVVAARTAIAEAAKQAAVAAAYKDAMQIVFKPTVVRESLYRNISGINSSSETGSVIKETD